MGSMTAMISMTACFGIEGDIERGGTALSEGSAAGRDSEQGTARRISHALAGGTGS